MLIALYTKCNNLIINITINYRIKYFDRTFGYK